MGKLQFSNDKTLKLQNLLIRKVDLEDEDSDLNVLVEQMQAYIQVKGAQQIGPLIQYTRSFVNNEEKLDLEINILLQCNNYIHSIEQPYVMKSLVRIPNCMYCRFTGLEEQLKFAYDKINLEAFENDIELTGESYTVFVDQDETDDIIIADVFMPKAKEE